MEVALREEARAKGLPEEMINKLVPLRPSKPSSSSAKDSSSTSSSTSVIEKKPLSAAEIKPKLGYLSPGDAVRFTSELDRLRSKGLISLWNSKDVNKLSKTDFQVSNGALKTRAKIDSVQLRLDDVGYKYQNVLLGAIVLGTVFGVGSSYIGGQIGFLMGYASALFPILLVGVGSIAPALIGDVVNRISILTNAETKEKYILQNAARFLVGYISGLPLSRFSYDGVSNTPEFFQIRPVVDSAGEASKGKAMFSKGIKETDIARIAMTCIGTFFSYFAYFSLSNLIQPSFFLAPNVAECLLYNEASGKTASDVGLLFEILNSVEPALKPEESQNYIRWAGTDFTALNSSLKKPVLII